MKRLILLLTILFVPLMLLSQTIQTDEITTLKENLNTLAKKNKNLQWQLTKFKSAEALTNDSLKTEIQIINKNFLALSDSVLLVRNSIYITDNKIVELQRSLWIHTVFVYIALFILLILIFVVYFIVIAKFKSTWLKYDNLVMNAKEGLQVEIGKVRKDLENKIEGHSHQQ